MYLGKLGRLYRLQQLRVLVLLRCNVFIRLIGGLLGGRE